MKYAKQEGYARDVCESAIKQLLIDKKIVKKTLSNHTAKFYIVINIKSLNPDILYNQESRDVTYSMDEVIEMAEKGLLP